MNIRIRGVAALVVVPVLSLVLGACRSINVDHFKSAPIQYTVKTEMNGQKLFYIVSPSGSDSNCFAFPQTMWSGTEQADSRVQWGQWTHPGGCVSVTINSKPDEQAGSIEVVPRRWPPVRTRRTNIMSGVTGQQTTPTIFKVCTVNPGEPTSSTEVELEKVTCTLGSVVMQNPDNPQLCLTLAPGQTGRVMGKRVNGQLVLRFCF